MSEARPHAADEADAADAARVAIGGHAPPVAPEAPRAIFRAAALHAHRHRDVAGRPLALAPRWTRWVSSVTTAACLAGLAFAALAPLGEYAQGIAVVRRDGRTLVTSTVAGIVQEVRVRPGEHVQAGQVLLRLDDAAPRAELRRIEDEYGQRLVELLRRPDDAGARQRLSVLHAERALARAHVGERTLVATQAGIVSDVRVHVGRVISPGDAIAAIEGDRARTVVVGVFPGHYRPMLSGDTRLFLELEGFPTTRIETALRKVAGEVVGPVEAMRFLGRDREGAIDLRGPVVVVESALESDAFTADDTTYRIYDGMQGVLEAKLRSRTLLERLVPHLQRAVSGDP